MTVIKNSLENIFQLCRFCFVGLAATAIHSLLFIFFVEIFDLPPIFSNFIAFFPSFIFSFIFHKSWTFRMIDREDCILMLVRFFVVAIVGLLLNTFWVFIVTNVCNFQYYISLFFIIFLTPLLLYLLNKFYVFK